MSKGRLEAFSDGVLAIVLTITVLKLTPPAGFDSVSLKAFGTLVLAYVIGFTFVGIQWINHHRLFDSIEWTGARPFESVPATVFCAILLVSGLSFNELQREIVRDLGVSSGRVSCEIRYGFPRRLFSPGAVATTLPAGR